MPKNLKKSKAVKVKRKPVLVKNKPAVVTKKATPVTSGELKVRGLAAAVADLDHVLSTGGLVDTEVHQAWNLVKAELIK